MAETQQSRLAMQVLVLGRDGVPVGSGFVCSPGHVMTCAHVVADALGGGSDMASAPDPPGAQVRVRFAFDAVEAETDVVAEAWRPRGAGACNDIAVLRIADGQPWPPQARPVTAVRDDPGPRTPFIGLGVSRDEPDGVIIEGLVGGLLPGGNRLSIHADSLDQKVVPGCSGAAVFTYERGGMAGMVVEMQQSSTGLMIPARLLQTVWQIAGHDEPAPLAPASASAPVKRRLAASLHTFDREDQGVSFEAAVQDLWKQEKLPIICLIGGLEADLPVKCQERCLTLNLSQSLGMALPTDRLVPLHMPWPPDRFFDLKLAHAALKRSLRSALDAEDVTPEAIRAARSKAGRAFFFFSSMRAEKFSTPHVRLVKQWSDFLMATSGGQVDDDDPLLHFIHLILPNSRFRSNRADPDEPLRDAYRKVVRGLEGGIVRPLPALPGFEDSLVDYWLARLCQDLALPADQASDIRASAQDKFVPMRHARLRDLRDWINTLN